MIVAGFGFRAGTSVSSLRAALALAQEGSPPVTLLATVADKAPALAPLADALGLALTGVSADALTHPSTPTRSVASLKTRGAGSVAEAAALAAAGPGARLLGSRHVSPDRMATCAIAEGTAN
ncbi:MAG: cobalamin biosynthesis protein [Pseudomonadota bacterium]